MQEQEFQEGEHLLLTAFGGGLTWGASILTKISRITMTKTFQRIAFLFPGQGAQYPGMAQDFVQNFSAARLTFEEADDLLQRPLSDDYFKWPEEVLTETKNSQTGIYVTSMAILRVVQELYDLKAFCLCRIEFGGVYSPTAGEWLPFREALPLVEYRGQFMNEACESTTGAMAVDHGIGCQVVVRELVREVNLPNDLWIANFNCPGQVVISGTLKGIEAGYSGSKST